MSLFTYEAILKTEPLILKSNLKSYGKDLFYIPTKDGKKFSSSLLSAYLMRVYPCATLRDTGEIYIYNETTGNYQSKGRARLEELIYSIFREDFNSKKVEPTIYHIKPATFIDREDFKLPLNYIPVKNGILKIPINNGGKWDISNISLEPNSPKHFVVNRIPVDYDPHAKCPIWKKFLNQILEPGDAYFLQEYVGYCLYRDFIYHKAVMLTGPTRTGKSTLLFVITSLLGNDNIEHIQLQDLKETFNRVKLYLKLANILSDIGQKELKDSIFFKQLTGGDYISARQLYKEAFSFKPYAKYLWSCNTIPYAYDDDGSFYERFKIILVNKHQYFPDDPETNPTLKYDLLNELPGILNWALEGLARLIKKRYFSNCEHWTETRKLWNMMSDPLASFMESIWIRFDSTGFVSKDDFYDHFVGYCKYQGISAWTKKKLGREINKRYVKTDILSHASEGPQGKQEKGWKGLALNDPDRSDEYTDAVIEQEREERMMEDE